MSKKEKKKKRDREEFWNNMDTFPLIPEEGPQSFPKLLWWCNAWAFVSWDGEKRQWLTDDDLAPFESEEMPTEWALLPPPPRRAIMEILEAMQKEGKF